MWVGLLASGQHCGARQGAVSSILRWGQFIPKILARDLDIQEVKALLGDNGLSTHDTFFRKRHFKIRKGN